MPELTSVHMPELTSELMQELTSELMPELMPKLKSPFLSCPIYIFAIKVQFGTQIRKFSHNLL